MEDSPTPLLGSPFVARAARWGIVAWAGIGVVILAYWSYRYVLYPIRVIFPPLIVATVIVFLLNPIVTMLERRGIPRVWGTLLSYAVFLSVAGFGLALLVPLVSRQVTELVDQVPSLLERAETELRDLSERTGLSIGLADLFGQLQARQGQALEFAGRITSVTAGVVHAAIVVILGPVIAIYLLVDLPKLRRAAAAAVPARRRAEAASLQAGVGEALGGFFRGQLLVALFVGLASMLGLYLIGLPYWAPIGLIAGLFNLVPMIGPFIGAVPALFVAFTASRPDAGLLFHPQPGWPLAIAAAIVLLIVQQVDNHIVSPNVVGRTVKLHPLTVILSVLAGGTVLGLWGMLLAVPAVATAKILVLHAWDTRASWPPPSASAAPLAPDARGPGGGVPLAPGVPPGTMGGVGGSDRRPGGPMRRGTLAVRRALWRRTRPEDGAGEDERA